MVDQIETATLRITKGEDYSAYIEWVDFAGSPVISDPASVAYMQVRDKATGLVVLDFEEAADPATEPRIKVYSESSVVQITCPRTITATLAVKRYDFDIVVDVASPYDSEAAEPIFSTPQRHRLIKGDVEVLERVTQAP